MKIKLLSFFKRTPPKFEPSIPIRPPLEYFMQMSEIQLWTEYKRALDEYRALLVMREKRITSWKRWAYFWAIFLGATVGSIIYDIIHASYFLWKG